jgi:hypothetical protein
MRATIGTDSASVEQLARRNPRDDGLLVILVILVSGDCAPCARSIAASFIRLAEHN